MKTPPQRWGKNLIKNHSFELYNNNTFDHWLIKSLTGTSTITRSSSVKYDGDYSCQVFTASGKTAIFYENLSITAGTKVRIRFWYRVSALLPIRLQTYFSTPIGTLNVQITPAAINTWYQYEKEITWGANDVGFIIENNSSNYVFYIDKVEVQEYKVIPTFDLEGVDDKIQILQESIADNLDWLQYSFGRIDRHEKDDKVYPACFVDDASDPIDMRPNDNWNAFSFWEVLDPGRILYPDQENSSGKYSINEYDVSVIFWINLKRIDSSDYNETRSKMREEIKKALGVQLVGKNVVFQLTEVFERDIVQIYSGYDLEESFNILKWPFVAFRFNGVLKYKELCPINYSYSL